jgi:hypothetical protein
MDPKGVFGMGVHKVQDESEMRELIEKDLANGKRDCGHYSPFTA